MNFKKYFAALGLVVVSTYLALLLLQESLVFFAHGKNTMDDHIVKSPFLDLCPPNEHMKFQPFEGMGADLVRRPDVGWILNPKTVGNHKGYLGDCFPYKKGHKTKRVVFLGDSFTGAIQVPYEKTFVKIVESRLQKKYPGWKIEAINLGIGGYGTDQEYFTLIREAKKYSPDLIIHDIFLGNDIRDNSYNLYRYSEWPAHWPHPIKKYVTANNAKGLEYHNADLDYYYEMNLSEFFGRNRWLFDISGEKFLVTFNYDTAQQRLSGLIIGEKDREPLGAIDRVIFSEKSPFGLHFERADKWLHVDMIESDSISGILGDDKKMHFVGKRLPLEGDKYRERKNPIMSADESEGLAFASSYSKPYYPWRLFDGKILNEPDHWYSEKGIIANINIGYRFISPTLVTAYKITANMYSSYAAANPKSWRFEGSLNSTDGTDGDWVVLDSESDQVGWKDKEERKFNVNAPGCYRWYRVHLIENNGHPFYVSVGELEFDGIESETTITRLRHSLGKHIFLSDLREFVKLRLLRIYTFSRFLLKHEKISAKDMPIFQQLLEYQGNYPVDYQLFFEKYDDPEWEKAWNITFRLVEKMWSFSERTLHAPYVAVTIPSMETVYSDYWRSAQDYYPELKKVAAHMDVVKPVKMTDAFLKEKNIPHISLYQGMIEDYMETQVKLYDNKHAHFNEAGHQFVGSHIADFIINNKYLEH